MLRPIVKSIRLFCLLTAIPAYLPAHDLYILPDAFVVAAKGEIRVAYHNGDSFPESEAAPTLARLKEAQLRSKSTSVPVQSLTVDGKKAIGTVEVPSTSGNLLLSVHTVPNFISLDPEKFLAYLKEEGLTKVIQWRAEHGESKTPGRERYSKFAKSLLLSGTPDEYYKQVLGFPIEIIPEANPYRLHSGDKLTVRVMFRGKPAADLQLEAAWTAEGKSRTRVIGRTDSEGRILLPIAAAGKWRLHALMMERCAEPAAADWESFWASLTFQTR